MFEREKMNSNKLDKTVQIVPIKTASTAKIQFSSINTICTAFVFVYIYPQNEKLFFFRKTCYVKEK